MKWRFIKYYSLEIYTVFSLLLLVYAATTGNLSVIQKLVVIDTFLFVLHEWEETRYPGGFTDLLENTIQIKITDNQNRIIHLAAGIFLFTLSVASFVFDNYPIITMALATLGIFEAIAHTAGIFLSRSDKFYTPGMVTAYLEMTVGIVIIIFLVSNHLGRWYDYVFGPVIVISGYLLFQRIMANLLGIVYSDMLKTIKRQFGRD